MNASKNFKVLLAGAALLSLVSCGSDSSSSKSAPEAQVDELRLSQVDWKIFSKRGFPMGSKIEINDKLVLDECANKQPFEINRNVMPHSVSMPNYDIPVEGAAIKVVVSDCETGVEDFASESVEYELTKTGSVAELVINL